MTTSTMPDPVRELADAIAGTDPRRVRMLPVDALDADGNVRSDPGDLSDLTASIRSRGVLEPLLVEPPHQVPDTDPPEWRCRVLAGSRRLAAARAAGLDQVPCIVIEGLHPAEQIELGLVENLCRRDLSPIEEARAFQRLQTEHKWPQRRIADTCGRNQSHVSKRLSLLKLPEDVQAKVDAGGITAGAGAALAKLADEPEQLQEALAHAQRYGGGEDAIRREAERRVEDRRLRVKRERVLAELREQGLSVIDRPDAYAAWDLGGRIRVQLAHIEGVTEARHRKGGCHAVAVLRDGTQVPVCTQPDTHADAEETDWQRETRLEREAQRQRNAALKAAAKARRRPMQLLLEELGHDAAHAPKVAAEQLRWVAGLLAAIGGGYAQEACGLLGLRPVELDPAYEGGPRRKDWPAALRGYVDRGGAPEALAALGALACAAAEHRLGNPWAMEDAHALVAAHLDRLAGHGHEVSDAERELVTPDPDHPSLLDDDQDDDQDVDQDVDDGREQPDTAGPDGDDPIERLLARQAQIDAEAAEAAG